MTTYTRQALAAILVPLTLAACGGASTGGGGSSGGGGGGGGGGGSTTTGIALPSEVSALPATGAGTASLARRALASQPAGDYAAAVTTRVVSEQALSQFDILNTIFGAVAQTHYADAGNVGTGAYAAMVSWLDENDDRAGKQIVRWVVDSQMITVGGAPVNQLKVWFFDSRDGLPHVIKVGLRIFEAPTRNDAGGYSDYGVWTLDAKLSSDTTQWFVAAADRVTVGGHTLSRVMIHEMDRNQTETKGILLRADGLGFGRVSYPDWNQCNSDSCTPPAVEVAYVYDANHVALQRGNDPVIYKSRADVVDVVRRYGLYDAGTGTDVTKSFSFGFPIRAMVDGVQRYGYYGSWQGHHQIWAGGGSLPKDVTVHRGDTDSDAVSYVTSDLFLGVLTERTYADSSLDEITNVVLNTYESHGAQVHYDGATWTACFDPQWSGGPQPTCAGGSQTSADPATFFSAQRPQQVSINHWSQASGSQSLVYDNGTFTIVSSGPNGTWTPSGTWTPQPGDDVWAWRSGPIWIVYDGAGWKQKEVMSFDPQRNQPTFGPAQDDTDYVMLDDRDYNLNQNGVNYVVRYTAGIAAVKVEQQRVPNPVDAATLIPTDLRFQRSCCGDTASTFRFVTTPGAHYLQLVYATPGPQDAAAGHQTDDLVTEGIWNLVAVGEPDQRFSWDYPSGDNTYAVQQYLLKNGAYQVLHDPLRFAAVSLTPHGGQARKFALQFDGSWLGGVPDVQQLLRDAGGDMSADIAAQVVSVEDGRVVTDAIDTTKQYVFKPLQVAQFLMPIDDPGNLALGPATALDLSVVPVFVDPDLGTPPVASIRYSEGLPVP